MKIALSGLWESTRRTFVPLIVGAIVGWLIRLGVPLDPAFEASLYSVIDLAAAGVYFFIVRLLEIHVSPKFSLLLGSTKQPLAYAKANEGGIPVITNVEQLGTNTATLTVGTKPTSG